MAVAATASAAQSQNPLVTATIHERDGTTPGGQATFAYLFANEDTCPTYSGSDFEQHFSATHVDRPVDYPQPFSRGDQGTWPVASILACLQPTPVPLASVGSVVVADSGSPLSQADLRTDGGNDFQDPGATPIVLSGGSAYEYHRPAHGDDDFNGDDVVTPATHTAIRIDVYTGELLDVDATASPPSVGVNDPVTFSATVPGHDPSGLSYQWTFSDGRTSNDPQPRFSYSQPGTTVTAMVEVTDGHGGGGVDRVTVGVTGGPVPTPTADPTRSGPPDGSNGPAPPGTASPHNHSPGKTNGSGERPSTSPGAQGGKKQPSAQTRPQATATPSSAAPGGGTSSGSGPGAGGSSPSSRGGAGHRRPAAPDRQRHETTPDAGLERVTGRLVSDVIPLSAATSPLVTAAPRGSAPAERRHATGSSAPAIIEGSLAVLLLLALGAARELDVRWRTLWPRFGG